MKYAIIENEIITNIIVADQEFIFANFPDAIICPDEFGVGDKYVNKTFVRETTSVPIVEE